MILIECDQGSPEWHQARAGCITASMFKVARQKVGMLTAQQQKYVDAIRAGIDEKEAALLAGYKARPKFESMEKALAGEAVGDWSDAAKNYAFRLAVERISGVPLDEGFQTWQMKRGQELEPEARRRHEEEAGVIVQRAGFITTDDGRFGASADGLIGEDSGSEYKCLVSPEGLRDVLLNSDISEFIDQVQGCMWLTGRKTWHFGLYCPALAPVGSDFTWREVARDESYIEALEADLVQFMAVVDDYQAKLTRFSHNPGATDLRLHENAAREKVASEQAAAAEEERIRAENAANKTQVQDTQKVLKAEPETADATARVQPAITSPCVGTMGTGQPADAGSVADETATAPAAVEDNGTRMNLGQINERLAPISLTADGLAELGFPHVATDKSAKLYRECDFPSICQALIAHIAEVSEQFDMATA